MNIYRQLGAQPENGFHCLDKYPYVWSDGSTNEQTKAWAIKKLGFNDPRLEYGSWCERGDKSNVVPFRVHFENVTCYLSPLATPGTFDLEWARWGIESVYIFDLTPDQLYDAVLSAKRKSLDLLENMHKRNIWTENPHYDSRFELHKDTDEHYWTCDGQKVDYMNFWTAVPFSGMFYRLNR